MVRWRLLSEVRSRALLGFFGETDPGIHAKMCNLGLDEPHIPAVRAQGVFAERQHTQTGMTGCAAVPL